MPVVALLLQRGLRKVLFPAVLLAFALPAISAAQEGAALAETGAAPQEKKNEQPRDVTVSVVTLADGQTLRGQIVSETQDSVTLELVAGGRMELNRSSIRSITQSQKVQVTSTGDVWFRDPNRTRYFYAPSAMMLKRGEGYFSQKELFFSAIAYGLTDNVTVLLGSVVPLWFTPVSSGTSGINLIGALKVGFSLTDNFHLAAGAETLTLPIVMNGGIAGGFVFASATYGNANAHITLSGGKPFALTWGSSSFSALGDALFVLAGELRVGPNFALMTENWIMPYLFTAQPDVLTLDAVGGRLFGDRWAVDLGFIFMPRLGGGIPIPWLDFTYNFGG